MLLNGLQITVAYACRRQLLANTGQLCSARSKEGFERCTIRFPVLHCCNISMDGVLAQVHGGALAYSSSIFKKTLRMYMRIRFYSYASA